MGAPLSNPSNKKNPISDSDKPSDSDALPSTAIVAGVLISVAIGLVLLAIRHFRNKKKSEGESNGELSTDTTDQTVNDSPSEKQTTIQPDTKEHDSISERFSN